MRVRLEPWGLEPESLRAAEEARGSKVGQENWAETPGAV